MRHLRRLINEMFHRERLGQLVVAKCSAPRNFPFGKSGCPPENPGDVRVRVDLARQLCATPCFDGVRTLCYGKNINNSQVSFFSINVW